MSQENQEKKGIGRKKNPDKKKMIGIYHRPSEIEILGGMKQYKQFIYTSVEAEISRLVASKSVSSSNL